MVEVGGGQMDWQGLRCHSQLRPRGIEREREEREREREREKCLMRL